MMKTLNRPMTSGLKRQQGAILMAVLVVVAIMTLTGIAATRSSNVDAVLAQSGKARMEAMLSAEDALAQGELAICPHLANDTVCTGMLVTDFDETTTDGLHLGRQLVNIDGITDFNEIGAETLNSDQKYIIEYLDTLTPPGASLSVGTNTVADIRYVFRITAHGRSAGRGQSIIQSHYAVRR